ncbi:hypothetical protein RchiOBHm_Chr3g0486511 [Rosa chinensis]|uniref:Uncharacterized protein n=1 Tax=Rosa chinensis TaxID=74649 RepID=A0A2P6RF93_ROSCH|nr:hypothetical protein RchiOBHm_Chr3g0486511 [Rosa chinensis]
MPSLNLNRFIVNCFYIPSSSNCSVLLGTLVASDVKISPSSCFKGAHGISSISSVAFARLSSNQTEICSATQNLLFDIILFFFCSICLKDLEFIGMKQVKELSLIQSVSACNSSVNKLSNCHYAAGFASVDFIIWNLLTDTKVNSLPAHHIASSKMIYKILVFFIFWCLSAYLFQVFQIPCGGWRRPHFYYLGDVPEIKNCFAYVKDDIIYIH